MLDIEFIIPINAASETSKIILPHVNDLMFKNTSRAAYQVTFLVGFDGGKSLIPKSDNVRVLEYAMGEGGARFGCSAGKRAAYMLGEDHLPARWYMFMDPDTSTNVAGLLAALDSEYRHEDALYLSCGRITIQDRSLVEYTTAELAVPWWRADMPYLADQMLPWNIHDHEACLFTSLAYERMLDTGASRKLIEYVASDLDQRRNVTDAFTGLAARLAMIHPVQAYCLTPYTALAEYSAFAAGGRFHHIHYISPAYWSVWRLALDLSSGAVKVAKRVQRSDLVGARGEMYNPSECKKSQVVFQQNGELTGCPGTGLNRWDVIDGVLELQYAGSTMYVPPGVFVMTQPRRFEGYTAGFNGLVHIAL